MIIVDSSFRILKEIKYYCRKLSSDFVKALYFFANFVDDAQKKAGEKMFLINYKFCVIFA